MKVKDTWVPGMRGLSAEKQVYMPLRCLQLHTPPFPAHVLQLVKEGECYSWGAFGWLLNSGKVAVKKYRFFVLVDASVRGPFIAPYVPVSPPPSLSIHPLSSSYSCQPLLCLAGGTISNIQHPGIDTSAATCILAVHL